MPQKRRTQKPPEDEAVVRFRPILGVSPRTYVPVGYGVLIAILLFFLLLFPGIRNRGTVMTLESLPPGASVLVDDVRLGATPFTVFVEKGERVIEIRKPFFESSRETLRVGERLFGSLIVPRRMTYETTLVPGDHEAMLYDTAAEYSRWGLVGNGNAQYQFPLLLSPAIEALYFNASTVMPKESGGTPAAGTSGRGEAAVRMVDELLLAAAASTRGDTQLRDLSRATFLADASGGLLGARQLVATTRRAAFIAETRPASLLWYAGVTNDVPDYVEYQRSDFFSGVLEEHTTELLTESLRADRSGQEMEFALIAAAATEFAFVPTGAFVLGGMEENPAGIDPFLPSVVRTVQPFYIMRREVTVEEFRRFVGANPQYAPEMRDALIERGLADEGYLAPFGDRDYLATAPPDEPVVAVPFAVAAAYADWIEGRLSGAYAGYSARLPREEEWEWAARLNAENPADAWLLEQAVDGSTDKAGPRPVDESPEGRIGAADFLGNVWEWCDDWYRPAAYAFKEPGSSPTRGLSVLPAAMKVVRGGSWANEAGDVSVLSRGAQSPVWSTPYLGFRVILVNEDGR